MRGRPMESKMLRQVQLLFRFCTISLVVWISGCREDSAQEPTPSASAAPLRETVQNEDDDGVLSNALDALKNGASKVQDAVEPYTAPVKDTAVESIQKIVSIDYKIIEVDTDEPSPKLEAQLKELGLERWDCSPMPTNEFVTRFLCKRFPLNAYAKALSLLPKLAVD